MISLVRTQTRLRPGAVRHLTNRQRLTLASLALVDFISFCSMSIMAPFFPREATAKGLTDTMCGMVFSFYAVVMFFSVWKIKKCIIELSGMTMDERFTLLAAKAPDRVIKQKRRPNAAYFLDQSYNNRNRDLIEEIARQLGYHDQKQSVWQGMGLRQNLRRYGSESSLLGLRRSNSFGNLTQQSIRSRLNWRPNNNGHFRNRSRSVSVSSAPSGHGRGPRRRGGQRNRFRNVRYERSGSHRTAEVSRPTPRDVMRQLLNLDNVAAPTRLSAAVVNVLVTLYGHPVTDIAVHPSDKLALSIGGDKTLRTWNLVKGRPAFTINLASKGVKNK